MAFKTLTTVGNICSPWYPIFISLLTFSHWNLLAQDYIFSKSMWGVETVECKLKHHKLKKLKKISIQICIFTNQVAVYHTQFSSGLSLKYLISFEG
jgi:hypothetical protein